MKKATQFCNISKTKVALIDHLEGLKIVNTLMSTSKDYKQKAKLTRLQNSHIKSINTLIPFLNSVGKLNDREVKNLLSLDLMTLKKTNLKYRIGKNSGTGVVI